MGGRLSAYAEAVIYPRRRPMNIQYIHPADQLVMFMQRIYDKGLTTTSGGNLSIKDDEGNIPDRVVVMLKDLDGNYYEPMFFEVPDYFE